MNELHLVTLMLGTGIGALIAITFARRQLRAASDEINDQMLKAKDEYFASCNATIDTRSELDKAKSAYIDALKAANEAQARTELAALHEQSVRLVEG